VTKQVVPSRNAGRDRERNLAFVSYHPIHTPRCCRSIKAIFIDLEPFEARNVGLEWVRDLSADTEFASVKGEQSEGEMT
jgi:hypothetical protein